MVQFTRSKTPKGLLPRLLHPYLGDHPIPGKRNHRRERSQARIPSAEDPTRAKATNRMPHESAHAETMSLARFGRRAAYSGADPQELTSFEVAPPFSKGVDGAFAEPMYPSPVLYGRRASSSSSPPVMPVPSRDNFLKYVANHPGALADRQFVAKHAAISGLCSVIAVDTRMCVGCHACVGPMMFDRTVGSPVSSNGSSAASTPVSSPHRRLSNALRRGQKSMLFR